mmetsp:Transcript_36362/g.87437  ORF Transcript_36362/g.87437 Transcript_36362/m.87437 type:complete len:209 (+) Transcript_36362:46-672(+)
MVMLTTATIPASCQAALVTSLAKGMLAMATWSLMMVRNWPWPSSRNRRPRRCQMRPQSTKGGSQKLRTTNLPSAECFDGSLRPSTVIKVKNGRKLHHLARNLPAVRAFRMATCHIPQINAIPSACVTDASVIGLRSNFVAIAAHGSHGTTPAASPAGLIASSAATSAASKHFCTGFFFFPCAASFPAITEALAAPARGLLLSCLRPAA